MNNEDISKLDFFLKTIKSPTDSNILLDIDDLIVIKQDPFCTSKIKNSAFNLNHISNIVNTSFFTETWYNLFSKQLRYSVNRAKKIITNK